MVTSKKLSLGVWLLFLFSSLNAQSKDASKILSIENLRFAAMMHADTAALRPMLADDLVYIHSNALVERKLEHLAAIGLRKLVYEKMDREAAEVRFYGKTALVNGTIKVQGILNGNAFAVRLLYLAVYRKKRHTWQLVHWQSTRKV
jgi:ketosteroid isomerase-like protein